MYAVTRRYHFDPNESEEINRQIQTINQNNFSFPAMRVAVAGAVILLVILNLFRRRGYRLR